ncbi:MAG: peptide chain release factor N(5)-glutamine methyltransferase [Sphingomicrobium sp.]
MSALERSLNRATDLLAKTSDTARLDAELLMAHSLGIERDRLILNPPGGSAPAKFDQMVARRALGEPVAYITGRRAFWNIELEVGPGALVPRPDSETLIAAAIEHFAGSDRPKRVLDLGTGPGTLLLAALDQWPRATGIGVDASDAALDYARANAKRLEIAPRSTFRRGDWAKGIGERFDLVLINPPYVAEDAELGPGVAEFEPAEALFAGPDGLDDYRRLAPEIARLLAPLGLAAIEIGYDQGETAGQVFRSAGLEPRLAFDLGGRPRALLISA